MKLSHLKKIRVVISLVFLLATTLVFIDYRNILPEKLISSIVYLQFVPSLLKFINLVSITILGFMVVTVMTLLFGRVYCSTICPLGILQDVISRIARRFKKKKKRYYAFSQAHNILRYSLLALSIIVFLLGSVFVVSLLDPYSNFGRIMTYFGKPVVVLANNGISAILEKFDIFSLYPVNLVKVPLWVMVFPVIIVVLVVWLSVTHGRLYCNTVCPVGALLGLLSKVALFRIIIDEEECTQCSLCARVCKASCMDFSQAEVDFSRCVGCYNCLTVCPTDAVKYKSFSPIRTVRSLVSRNGSDVRGTDSGSDEPDLGKRKFVKGSLAYFLGLAGISIIQEKPVNKNPTTVPEDKEFPVSPPGSLSLENFNDYCTACTLCISACPTFVLQPSILEYGLTGIMQPHMDYHVGYCNYDCMLCADICPTGAILQVDLEKKKQVQMGIAKFIKENCIVHTDKTDCGACSEVCPTKSCHMIPYEGTLVIPEVLEKTCVGCGACEFACPTTPYKAIYVNGNEVHQVAEKPAEEELKIQETDDWPF